MSRQFITRPKFKNISVFNFYYKFSNLPKKAETRIFFNQNKFWAIFWFWVFLCKKGEAIKIVKDGKKAFSFLFNLNHLQFIQMPSNFLQ